MHDLLTRLQRTKMALTCLLLVLFGAALIAVDNQLPSPDAGSWLELVPWNELGGILVGAGLLSVWIDHLFRREQAASNDFRLRQLLQEQAPAMRDAVLEAFAADHEDLARVATPDMLDQIIRNSLTLRLDDAQFAAEVYADIRDQAVGRGERWYDASLSIDVAPLPEGEGRAAGSTSEQPAGTSFVVTVRWEYTTVPRHSERRFACLSDRDEYAELAHERGATSAWYLKPAGGVDASSRESFELLLFSVNGERRPIRRAVRKQGQVYTASVGADHVKAGQPVNVAYTYRTITTQAGHLLFFDIEQPTRDLRVDFDYSGCGISSVATLDLVPSVRPTRIEHSPASLPSSSVRVELDGWIFLRSGIAFVWTLERESATTAAAASRRAA